MIDYFAPIVDEDDRPDLDSRHEDQLVVDANNEWTDWNRQIDSIRDKSVEARQLYIENRPDALFYNKQDEASTSNACIRRPVLAQAIDSTISQQHLASYPADERFFKGKPVNKEALDALDLYERHVEKRLADVEFLTNTLKDRKNLMLDGTSAVWMPFVRKKKMKAEYKFKTFLGIRLPGKPKKVKKEKVVFEGTAFIPLNFNDWVVEPTVDNFEEAAFQWRRLVSVHALKKIKAFKNTEDLTGYKNHWGNDENAQAKRATYEDMGITQLWDTPDGCGDDMAMVYERWGDFYIEGELYPNHVLIYANDSVFLYFGPNPYDHGLKPFAVSAYIPIGGTLYGKSLAQDIIPMCHALDTLANQALDLISIAAKGNFTYLATDESMIEYFGKGLVSLQPGEGIPVRSHDSLKPVIWDRSGLPDIAAMGQHFKEEIRETTGGVPYTTGGASQEDQQRTLGEVKILATGTGNRFQLIIQSYEQGKQKPYLNMVFENDRQFMTETVFIEDQMKPVTPSLVKMMDMEFDVTGSTTVINKAKELQEKDAFLMNYLPKLLENPQLATTNGDIVIFNVANIVKQAMIDRGWRDLDGVMEIKTVEEQQDEISQLGAIPYGQQPVSGLVPLPASGGMEIPQGAPGMAPPEILAA